MEDHVKEEREHKKETIRDRLTLRLEEKSPDEAEEIAERSVEAETESRDIGKEDDK